MIVDINGTFSKVNDNIPSEKMFHTFLIKDGYPIYVGDPLKSKKLMRLFNKSVNLK